MSNASQIQPESHRIASLDMLRALAVFLVIGHHAAWRFKPMAGDPVGALLKGSGWIGVDVFFAISGLMITSILWRDADHIKTFFVRRFYRIVPIFTVAMIVFAAAALATGAGAERLSLLWSPALLLNGWTIPFLGSEAVPFTITWSLSVEECAYLILGLSALAGRKGIRLALVTMVIVPPMVRIAVVTTGFFEADNLYFFVPARLDSIALGGLAAISAARPGYRRWHAPVAGCAVFGMIWLFQYTRIGDPRLNLVGYTVFSLTTALFVSFLAAADTRHAPDRVRGASAFRRSVTAPLSHAVASFGKLSYFIYLFHMFVLEGLVLLDRRLHWSLTYWQALALACLLVYGMAWVSWNYFEYPLIRRGRQRERSALPATAAAIHPSAQAPT